MSKPIPQNPSQVADQDGILPLGSPPQFPLESETLAFDTTATDATTWMHLDDRSDAEEPRDQPEPRTRGLSLRIKATLLITTLSTLPIFLVGAVAYRLADRTITAQVAQAKTAEASQLADKLTGFMLERLASVESLAEIPPLILSQAGDPEIPPEQQLAQRRQIIQAQLTNAIRTYLVFDSIALYDRQGNLQAQSSGSAPEDNPREQAYFQQVLQTGQPVVSDPIPFSSGVANALAVYVAAPVGNGDQILTARMPVKNIGNAVFRPGSLQTQTTYRLIDSSGTLFEAIQDPQEIEIGTPIVEELPLFPEIEAEQVDQAWLTPNPVGDLQLNTYAPIGNIGQLNWSVITNTSAVEAFGPQRQLLQTLEWGIGLTALLVVLLATALADRATRPIITASRTVQQIGQGNLHARVPVKGDDEMAVLGESINAMANQIQNLLRTQQETAQQQILTQTQLTKQEENNARLQQAAKEELQRRALELLQEVAPLRQGDLTIRANVTQDEIGTIADSYNATIGSLRKLVIQVKEAALQVSTTAGANASPVQDLAEEALQQARAIQEVLRRIETMSRTTEAVSRNAQQAEQVVQQASHVVAAGERAMDKTVAEIQTIRDTVTEVAHKMKQLGSSSLEISRVVTLISEFTAQTNLLALNASMVAARAGREGEAFAVIAEEIRALATQSAQATVDIEDFVERIQSETQHVAEEMEAGSQQVVMGTKLVEETRLSLSQITQASEQITQLVQSIAEATVDQSQSSALVAATITDVADISTYTSDRANQVLDAFQDLLQLAQELETTVGQFKLS